MIHRTLRGHTPTWGRDCWFAQTATLIGQVQLGDECSVWYNAVLRGDVNSITLGNRVNVQDGAILHATYQQSKTVIGDRVSIGHRAIVHGCEIHENVLVGMGAIIMDHAVVEANCLIAAGAVVLEGTRCESGSIYAGVPAKKIKSIPPERLRGTVERIADAYLKYAGWYQENDNEE